MLVPRTYFDYKQNPNYGAETAFREATATFITPFMPGLLGMLLMWKKDYSGLYTDSETLKTLHKAWENGGKNVKLGSRAHVRII